MDNKKIVLKAFKIIGAVIYALVTAFLIIMLISVYKDYKAQENLWELGGVFAFMFTSIASVLYIVPVVLGGIGMFISSKIQDKKSKIYFVFMIFVPVATAIANLVTYLVLLK